MAWNGSKEGMPSSPVVEEATAAPRWMRKEVDGSDGEAEVGDDPVSFPTTGDLMGSHRLSAAVRRLEQEIQCLREELGEVESRPRPSSAVCEEVVAGVECTPDGLLPVTPGPEDVAWDKWFQGAHGGRGESYRSTGRGGGRRWWKQGRRFLPSSSGEERVEALSK